jgi:hypothetical protein
MDIARGDVTTEAFFDDAVVWEIDDTIYRNTSWSRTGHWTWAGIVLQCGTSKGKGRSQKLRAPSGGLKVYTALLAFKSRREILVILKYMSGFTDTETKR